jgi:hypothetical protein
MFGVRVRGVSTQNEVVGRCRFLLAISCFRSDVAVVVGAKAPGRGALASITTAHVAPKSATAKAGRRMRGGQRHQPITAPLLPVTIENFDQRFSSRGVAFMWGETPQRSAEEEVCRIVLLSHTIVVLPVQVAQNKHDYRLGCINTIHTTGGLSM